MKTMTFKVTEDEARMIRSRAKHEQVSVSEYLRRRAGSPASPMRNLGHVRCPETGAMIFAASDAMPPLTMESVRECLSDFP
jgi:hypothetical protein